MGKGRKPLATSVKDQRGSFDVNPGRRNQKEPMPPPGWPEKPPEVSEDEVASAKWDYMCELMDQMKILTKADLSILATYCITYSEWLYLRRHTMKNGFSAISGKGAVITSPETHQYNKCADRLLKMITELGMTPSARSRIKVVGDEKEENPFLDLLQRRISGGSN